MALFIHLQKLPSSNLSILHNIIHSLVEQTENHAFFSYYNHNSPSDTNMGLNKPILSWRFCTFTFELMKTVHVNETFTLLKRWVFCQSNRQENSKECQYLSLPSSLPFLCSATFFQSLKVIFRT